MAPDRSWRLAGSATCSWALPERAANHVSRTAIARRGGGARRDAWCHRIGPVSEIAATLPWLLPGTIVALSVSILASGAVGRWLRVRQSVAWLGLLSAGVIVASTLTPLDPGSVVIRDVRVCEDFRTSLAPISEILRGSDATLNILLFVPLGLAIGLSPWSFRTLVVALLALASPFAIEALQFAVPPLGRGCETADIVDNVTGLVIGLVVGVVLALLVPPLRRPVEPGG
jgi:VanZ family protein